jgi:hypothetical protein
VNLQSLGLQPNAPLPFPLLPVAISSYPLCTLDTTSFPPIATYTPQIMPYFEGVWAQIWAQSIEVNPSVEITQVDKGQLKGADKIGASAATRLRRRDSLIKWYSDPQRCTICGRTEAGADAGSKLARPGRTWVKFQQRCVKSHRNFPD